MKKHLIYSILIILNGVKEKTEIKKGELDESKLNNFEYNISENILYYKDYNLDLSKVNIDENFDNIKLELSGNNKDYIAGVISSNESKPLLIEIQKAS